MDEEEDDPRVWKLIELGERHQPKPEELEIGREVLEILSKALLGERYQTACSDNYPALKLRYSTHRRVTLGIIPLDFYAWDLWTPNEPIACCIAGTVSRTTFHSLARARLRKASGIITIERGDRSEGTFNLQIRNIKIQLRYHANPLISRWEGLRQNELEQLKDSLPWESEARIEELERTHEIATKFFDCEYEDDYKMYFAYLQWAKNLGLYPVTLSREDILALSRYTLGDWSGECLLKRFNLPIPQLEDEPTGLGESLGPWWPKIKKNAFKTMKEFVRLERSAFGRERPERPTSVLDLTKPQWPQFFHLWTNFIRIDFSYWGQSSVTATKYQQAIEKAVKHGLLKELRKFGRSYLFHLWPYPFQRLDRPWMERQQPDDYMNRYSSDFLSKNQDRMLISASSHLAHVQTVDEVRESPQYELSYFIGHDVDRRSLNQNMYAQEVLFEVLKDALEWEDTTHTFVSLTRLFPKDVDNTHVPFIPYPLPIPEDPRTLTHADEEDEEDDGYLSSLPSLPSDTPSPSADESSPPTSATRPTVKPKRKSKSKSVAKSSKPAQSTPSQSATTSAKSSTFLRPSSDILHRIRHDAAYNSEDILIGYVDRHAGMKEIPFEWWTAENTAEDFIPQSRIRYFRRKSDGVVLWDREKRVDLVFRTGKNAGTDADGEEE